MPVHHLDVGLADGGVLRVHDTGPASTAATDGTGPPTVVWHHGTPNVGDPPAPLLATPTGSAVRWVSWDRPGYGGSTPRPGRTIASAAELAEEVLDHLGIDRFATIGHSGGGPHALACAALLPDRVTGVAVMASLAPPDAGGLAYFDGMAPGSRAALDAAARGRPAREAVDDGPEEELGFCEADLEALQGDWAWFIDVVRGASASGTAPAVDDDLAYMAPWGFDPAAVQAPALVVHGRRDRVVPVTHGRWLAERIGAPIWERPDDGHVSVMRAGPDALDHVVGHALG